MNRTESPARNREQMRMSMPQMTIVVGGQYGSEGKGAFIHEVADSFPVHVRVGGPQAGHSIKVQDPAGDIRVLKLQTIPVGAAVGAQCYIGMASVVDFDVLEREVGWFRELGIELDVRVDWRATVLDHDAAIAAESAADLTARLGSTGKGIGAARAARIMRTAPVVADWEDRLRKLPGVSLTDTSAELRGILDAGQRPVLVEAAQGILLSLFSSGHYPYVTSAESTPTGAFADLGLPLRYAAYAESVGVYRTYPIRVAGNSGPLPGETDWETVEARRGGEISLSEKTTTVTAKIRRVALWDAEEARRSARDAGVDWAVLSFLDYEFPEIAGVTDKGELTGGALKYIRDRELDLGIPIRAVGTGFGTYAWL